MWERLHRRRQRPARAEHGYVFEVPSRGRPASTERPVPIKAAGRFAHEAVDVDADTGILYQTEDNFGFPSGFYRYIAPRNPMGRAGRDGGRLEMLRVKGSPTPSSTAARRPASPTTSTGSRSRTPIPRSRPARRTTRRSWLVGDQGRARGAAIFSRLEGIFYDSGKVYLVRPRAGTPRPASRPRPASATARPALGLRHRRQTLTLLFESPSRTVLELPDNLCISPQVVPAVRGRPVENHLRGVTRRGRSSTSRSTRSRPRAGGVRRGDLRTGRQGPVREHPGRQRADVRDLGAVEEGRAVMAAWTSTSPTTTS